LEEKKGCWHKTNAPSNGTDLNRLKVQGAQTVSEGNRPREMKKSMKTGKGEITLRKKVGKGTNMGGKPSRVNLPLHKMVRKHRGVMVHITSKKI